MSLNKPVLLIAATVVALLAFTAIGFVGRREAVAAPAASAPAEASAAAPATVKLVLAEVKAAPAQTTLTLPGTLRAWQQTTLHPQATGYLKRYFVDLGDLVREGQVLAEIDSPTLDQDLLAARARVTQSEAALALAKSLDTRTQQLVQSGAVSRVEADTRATAAQAAAADLRVARAALSGLNSQSGYKKITAPFAGRITQRMAETGQLVDASSALFTLAETQQLRVSVQVPQSHMRGVQAGLDADVSLREYAGEVFKGTVSRTAGSLDDARTLTTEVRLPNADGRLLAGASVDVKLTLPNAATTMVIPANALIVNAKGTQVALVESGKLAMRPVRLGRDLGKEIEITEGLKAGDKVGVSAPDTARDGQAVEVVVPPPPVAAAAPAKS